MHKQMELFQKEFNPIEEYAKLGSGISGGKERIMDFFKRNKSLSGVKNSKSWKRQ